ncbi:MAG: hypothetical protein EHM42_00265 [Planctomycetaceae bacterium]|nr:MAG: hypothetical protein EHM42_00265 [Planctomycetaceae bacterium]
MSARRRDDDSDWGDDDRGNDDWMVDDDDDGGDDVTAVPCPYCRREIAEDAVRCPGCGNYLSKEDLPPERQRGWIVVTVIVCLFVVYCWMFGWPGR